MNEDTLSYFMAMLDLAVTGLPHFTQIARHSEISPCGSQCAPLPLCYI